MTKLETAAQIGQFYFNENVNWKPAGRADVQMPIFFYDGLDYDPIIANFFIGRLLGAPDVSAIFSIVRFYCVIKENRLEKATKWVRQTAFFSCRICTITEGISTNSHFGERDWVDGWPQLQKQNESFHCFPFSHLKNIFTKPAPTNARINRLSRLSQNPG